MGDLKIKPNTKLAEQTTVSTPAIKKWPWEAKENHLSSLMKVSQYLAVASDRDSALEKILETTLVLLKARRGFIMLIDPQTNRLSIKVAKGMPSSVIEQVSVKVGEGISGFVAQKGRPLLVDDLQTYRNFRKTPASRYESEAFFSVPIVSAPLSIWGEILGVLNVSDTPYGVSFTTEELALLSILATEAAMVLAYWQLTEKIKKAATGFLNSNGLCAGTMNEIQSSLTAITGHAQYLMLNIPKECKAAEVLNKIIHQTDEARAALKQLHKENQ